MVAGLLLPACQVRGETNTSFDVDPGVNGGDWRALVAGAAAHSIIRFHPGNYTAGADGCNVTLRDGVQLVATMPGEPVMVDCQGSGGRHFSVAEGASVVVDGLTFANGESHENAGCVLVRAGGSLEIRNSRLVNCNAVDCGGGVYIEVGGAFSAFNSTLENCASNGHGGAIYGIASSIVLTGGTYSGNTAGENGGLAYVDGSSLTVTQGAQAFENDAERGGCIFAIRESVVNITHGVILRDNLATAHGGAIYAHTSCIVRMTHQVQCIRNSATTDCGCIQLYNDCELHASDNVTFADNTAGDDGGAMCSQAVDCVVTLQRGTAGLCCGWRLTMSHCIFCEPLQRF